MEIIIAVVGIVAMSCIAFFIGKKMGNNRENEEKVNSLEDSVLELTNKNELLEDDVKTFLKEITQLTSDRDVLKNKAVDAKDHYEQSISDLKVLYESRLQEQKKSYEQQLATLRNDIKEEKEAILERNNKIIEDLKSAHEKQIKSLEESSESKTKALRDSYEQQLATLRNDIKEEKEAISKRNNRIIEDLKSTHEKQIKSLEESSESKTKALRDSYEKQLEQVKSSSDKQLEALKEMNKKQVESQLSLIREQMRTTSEDVLKARQEELGAKNKEQVSKIIDPLQKSLKDMQEALNNSKEQQKEALTRLDQTIKQNMEKRASLGETADRLTRALTGEVKVQGNFGELKLKQLLEDLELKEGEQFDTQETLKDRGGKSTKGDDGKGLIPDFILHFPNNRHVVVDSKMSLTDYERYMNIEDGNPDKSNYLKAHINSVRAQVKRLAKKDYTKFLPTGCNKLNFAIMYVPIEGALNLALLNDTTLWREAYDFLDHKLCI